MEMRYENHEQKRKEELEYVNSQNPEKRRFEFQPAGPETRNPRDRIPRQEHGEKRIPAPTDKLSDENQLRKGTKLRKIPRRARPTNPTMVKFDHEMTEIEKVRKETDDELLELQQERDKVKVLNCYRLDGT